MQSFETEFFFKILICHRQVIEAFKEAEENWYECPAQKQIDDALTAFAKIKFMDAKAAKEKRQQRGGQLRTVLFLLCH